MIKKILFSCFLCLSALVYADSGFYVGVNAGNAMTQDNLNVSSETQFTSQTNKLGLGLLAGYQFNSYIAAELNYLLIGSHASSYRDSNLAATTNAYNSFLTANAKGILPLASWFSLFGKAGVGYNFVSADGTLSSMQINRSQSLSGNSSNLVPMLGIGLDFNLVGGLSVVVENDYYMVSAPTISNADATSGNFGLGNVNYTSIGIKYLF